MRKKVFFIFVVVLLFIPGQVMAEATPACGIEHQSEVLTIVEPATTTKNGKIYEQCSVCGQVLSTKTIYRVQSFSLSPDSYAYDGARKSPILTITDCKGKVIRPNNYNLKNVTNFKTVGRHSYKVTFRGNYKGTKTVAFTIKPKSVSFRSVVKRKTSLTLKWPKVTKQVTGYQIKFSSSKKFPKKTTKNVKITSYKTTAKTFKKLKSKKTYYAKIRTYKKVDGKIYYSSWSKTVKMKTL